MYLHWAPFHPLYHFYVPGIPDPPSGGIGVSNIGTSVTLTWSSPPYDGGCMITGYVVEMRIGTQPWVELNER